MEQTKDNSVKTSLHSNPSVTPHTFDRAPSSQIAIVTVANVTKAYILKHQTIQAVNDVSFEVYEGEFVVLMGASGSGKSTLLQLLGGLERPTSGSIIVDGTNIAHLSDRKISIFRGKTIGFIFQFFYLQPFLKLGRNIEVPGMFSRMKRKERQERVQQLAKIVGLSDRLDHFPAQLSGGQIQRAAVIRALLNQPKILLADEPTGNLDSQNSEAIIALFEKIRKQFGTTIIVATHDPSVAAKADRIITIGDGVII